MLENEKTFLPYDFIYRSYVRQSVTYIYSTQEVSSEFT